MTTISMPNALFMALEKISVQDLAPQDRKIIWIPHTTTIGDALGLLQKYTISSCPVIDTTTNLCVGGIDFVTMLRIVQNQISTFDAPVSSVARYFAPFYINKSLIDIIALFTSGAHRALLYKTDYELTCTVSQTDVISKIATILNEMQQNANQHPTNPRFASVMQYINTTLVQLNGVLHAPITLDQTKTLYDALELCNAKDFRTIGITNREGQLIGEFTLVGLLKHSAALGINSNKLQNDPTCLKEITLLQYIEQLELTKQNHVVCVDLNSTTIGKLVELFVLTDTKTIYSLDENKKPVQIISQTDVLSLFRSSSFKRVELENEKNSKILHSLWV